MWFLPPMVVFVFAAEFFFNFYFYFKFCVISSHQQNLLQQLFKTYSNTFLKHTQNKKLKHGSLLIMVMPISLEDMICPFKSSSAVADDIFVCYFFSVFTRRRYFRRVDVPSRLNWCRKLKSTSAAKKRRR